MPSAFETGERRAIPAVLIYARANQDGRILMIHRNAGLAAGREAGDADFHSGKWNGLGGKQEADESPLEGARREFQEEAGLKLDERRFRVLGFLQFPNFKPQKREDWLVTVLTAELDEREAAAVARSSAEGDLHWKAPEEFARLNFWPGDRYFLPFVLERRPFSGTIWYRDGAVARHWVAAMGEGA